MKRSTFLLLLFAVMALTVAVMPFEASAYDFTLQMQNPSGSTIRDGFEFKITNSNVPDFRLANYDSRVFAYTSGGAGVFQTFCVEPNSPLLRGQSVYYGNINPTNTIEQPMAGGVPLVYGNRSYLTQGAATLYKMYVLGELENYYTNGVDFSTTQLAGYTKVFNYDDTAENTKTARTKLQEAFDHYQDVRGINADNMFVKFMSWYDSSADWYTNYVYDGGLYEVNVLNIYDAASNMGQDVMILGEHNPSVPEPVTVGFWVAGSFGLIGMSLARKRQMRKQQIRQEK